MTNMKNIGTDTQSKFFTIFIDGVEFHLEQSTITGGEIMDLGGIPRETGLVAVLEDGTQVSIAADEVVELQPGRRFKKAPRFIRGHEVIVLSQLEAEIQLLRRRYGEIEFGENLDWLVVKEFRMPLGWSSEVIELLVLIPPGYPITPPDNFYVRNGLRTSTGAMPGNYSESQSVLGSTWAQFSFHAKDWNPSSDMETSDNLLTFMLGVERRLSEAD